MSAEGNVLGVQEYNSSKNWIYFQHAKARITSSQQKQIAKDHIVVKKRIFSGLFNELFIPCTLSKFSIQTFCFPNIKTKFQPQLHSHTLKES